MKQTRHLFFKTCCNILSCFDPLQMFGLLLGIFYLSFAISVIIQNIKLREIFLKFLGTKEQKTQGWI